MNDSFTIAELIRSSAGFVVEVCGIYVGRMISGEYHVVSERPGDTFEHVFDNAYSAAYQFTKERSKRQLGFRL